MIRKAATAFHDWLFKVRSLRGRESDPALCVIADVSHETTDQMLDVICEAFLIPEGQKYCLRPTDELMAIYKSINRFSAADSMEYETLLMLLEERFGIEISEAEFLEMKTVADVARIVSRKCACA